MGPSPPAPVRPRRRTLRRAVAFVFMVSVVVPVLQVLWLRVADPLFTWTMVGAARMHHQTTGSWALPAYEPMSLEALGPNVARMAVASEDANFWHHQGIDFGAVADAVKTNQSGGTLRGGSTISQQVARNAFLWQERSWLRKGLEVVYTVLLEALVPKERILEVYLNIAETGPMTFGMQAGAKRWFGKPAAALSRDQAARIVAILPSPRKWKPTGEYAGTRAGHIARNHVPFPGETGFERAATAAAARSGFWSSLKRAWSGK